MAADADRLPGGDVLVRLPALGANHRAPNFWSDDVVRRLVIALHRQVQLDEARDRICAAVGPERTPSKSALQRAWARIDKAIDDSRARPVRRAR